MQRIRFFDIAKGIAILAVILGHSAIEANVFIPHHTAQLVVAVCFSFHMPLFFILSGYFMHPERSFRWAKESQAVAVHIRSDGRGGAGRCDVHGHHQP